MIRTIYLIRHPEFENPQNIFHGRLPVVLSQEGRDRASRVADWFADKAISQIYSSAVLRCKQMSEIIAAKIQVPISYDLRLLETLSVMQGMSMLEFEKYNDRPFTFLQELGGESPQQIQDRMIDFFQTIKLKDEGNVIICSHGDPLMFLYFYLTNEQLPDYSNIVDVRKFAAHQAYPKKGSIRPIVIDGDTIQVQDSITL